MKVYERYIKGNARLHSKLKDKLYVNLLERLGDHLRNAIKVNGCSNGSMGHLYECSSKGVDAGCIVVLAAQYYSTVNSKPTNGFLKVKTLGLEQGIEEKLEVIMKELKLEKLSPLDKVDGHEFECI